MSEPPNERGSSAASRRSHRKTRSGCRTCKTRKIKCDEKKPACGNCIRHNVECGFLALAPRSPRPTTGPGLDLNRDHMELLHNFTISTYATLSENLVMKDFYRVTAVQMGLDCDYVMRSLLAISSLQLAFYRPQMRDHYLALATQYHDMALEVAITLVSSPTPTTAEPLFLFSILTIYYALGYPRPERGGALLTNDDALPDWLLFFQGTLAFAELVHNASGPLGPVFKIGIDRWMAQDGKPRGAAPVFQHLDRLHDLIANDVHDERLRSIYSYAVTELGKSFAVLSPGPYDLIDAFVWVNKIAEGFLPLLRTPTQEAVAIFAFFPVLLQGIKSQWWSNGLADSLMALSYHILDREHRLWIQWPMEELGWVPE
ncbi:hypothetical protein F5Y19DRAFT_480694 [Xylariaceae sp. FL1651]|nr:hypothetical protein F5Y19DRAFT_480694 [Xylariaceae sp. FL1651]